VLGERYVEVLHPNGLTLRTLVMVHRGGKVSVAFWALGRAYWFDGLWDGATITPETDLAEQERFEAMRAFLGTGFGEASAAWCDAAAGIVLAARASREGL